MKNILHVTVLVLFPGLLLAQAKPQSITKQAFVLGITDSVRSVYLNETRGLNIYLPPGYSPDSATLYPVIYLLDGSADEDFIHITGLVQFCNFPWVNLLPRSIVVGIANADRRRDFTFPTGIVQDKKDYPTTGGSANFISFIGKELQPYIEANYHVNQSKMIIGQSLGGLLATEILFTQPALFTDYVIVSPSLWWNNESLLKEKLHISEAAKKRVYVAVGEEGTTMITDAEKLFALLQQQGVSSSFRLFKDEDHATIFHEAVYRAFQTFAGKGLPAKK